MTLASIVTAGLFIGVVKGHDAKTKWMNKRKGRQEQKKVRLAGNTGEVMLDDYELESFHN